MTNWSKPYSYGAKFLILFLLFALLILAANGCEVARAQDSEYGLLVNTHSNRLTLYKKIEGVWHKGPSVKCCTGAHGATPKGEFTISSKASHFEHDDKTYDYHCRFDGKKGFHSVPRLTGTKDYNHSSLGHSQSNGCVRLNERVAKWIYDNCPVGTKVIIK